VSAVVHNVPQSEIDALHDLYQATNGVAWNWHGRGNKWNFTAPNPCADSWQGVTCSQAVSAGYLHVLDLLLQGFGLAGAIPVTLGDLTQLQQLQLSSNSLTGRIPTTFAQFLQLTSLSLFHNALTGTIPDSLGQLSHLTDLYLYHNQLNGSIPQSLGQCAQLSDLQLDTNQLTGTIPAALSQCRLLSGLQLQSNELTGSFPSFLAQLTRLTTLQLSDNQLTGSLPSTLEKLTLLSALGLSANQLTGYIPPSLGNCTRLSSLYLDGNQLTGTLPATLGQLQLLNEIELDDNRLTGSLPPELGNCTLLAAVSAAANFFTGTLPSTLAHCPLLYGIQLNGNHLTGSIPDSLSALKVMAVLDVGVNFITGTLPAYVGNWSQLSELNLYANFITGTVPTTLGQCAQLKKLNIYENLFSGLVPASLSQCSILETLDLDTNSLTGTIPAALEQCTKLTNLKLFLNQLSGAMPSALGMLRGLTFMQFFNNQLTGTIPSALANCSDLSVLYLDNNVLSGTVPYTVLALPRLLIASMQDNWLTGTLPATAFSPENALLELFCDHNLLAGPLADATAERLALLRLGLSYNMFSSLPGSLVEALHVIDFLILNNNHLSGSIPQNWTAAAHTIGYLYLQENDLTGPLPESLGNAPLLLHINMSSNRLSGTIPASFQQLRSLQLLMLQDNQLRGSIEGLFDSALQRNLSTVQLSSNQLTGTLPAAAFLLPSLSSFAAVENCFDGPLPEEAICSGTHLTALVLDGLHSASSCKRSRSRFTLGSLPSCVLSLPNLVTLHLSGSGLTGSLSADDGISAALTDLSLSHNLLTGTIPASILDRDWDKLDLSYNRLAGTLHSAREAPYRNTTELHLQHNRLSGVIPGNMQRVGTLSSLVNNMFSCRVDRSDVPQQDSDSNRYACGSDAVNNALYAWLGAAAVLIAACLWAYRSAYSQPLREWFSVIRDNKLARLQEVFRAAAALTTLGAGGAAYGVVVLLPVYAAVNTYYPSFTYKYAWTVSGVFLSGTTAFALEATFLLLQLPLCGFVAEQLLSRMRNSPLASAAFGGGSSVPQSLPSDGKNTVADVAVMLFSLTVVTGINIGFVYATLGLRGRELTVIQILLAVFKLGFNNVVAPALHNRVKKTGAAHDITTAQVLLVLLNVIVIPCLVVMVISPACFYDALKGTDSVTASFTYSGDCLSLVVVTDPATGFQTLSCQGAETATADTAYTPFFAYSYQCSSSFVTSYAPTFVIMCIISGFVLPAQRLLLLYLRRVLSPTSRLYTMVIAATPRILKELPNPQDLTQARTDPLYRPVFSANHLVMSLLTYLALLLTFGALFPPLAVCCAVAMASVVLTTQLEVGRYVSAAVAGGRQDCLDEVESACAGVATPQQLRVALYLVLALSCMFYMLFLFDTLGDEVGFAGTFWVLIVVPLLPLIAFVVTTALGGLRPVPVAKTAHAADPEVGMELATLPTALPPAAVVDVKTETGMSERVSTFSSDNPMHAP
jgi:Leucine-rich repeat (LRR) protein